MVNSEPIMAGRFRVAAVEIDPRRMRLADRIEKPGIVFSSIVQNPEEFMFASSSRKYLIEKAGKIGLDLTKLTDDDVAFLDEFKHNRQMFELKSLATLCEFYFRGLSRIHIGRYMVSNASVWQPVPNLITHFQRLELTHDFGPTEKYFEQLPNITKLARRIF